VKALLLGPNGQLGSDIQAANAATGSRLSITPVGRAQLDLEDLERTTLLLRNTPFDLLINCASYHKTDEVERNAQKAFAINAHLVQRLAEICAQKRARFVHFSTDYVFGGNDEREPLSERDPKAPLNVYGASKAMGEDLALRVGCDMLILRVASLFGVAGSSGKGGNFVETMVRFGRERGELRVIADQFMSPTATASVADVLLKLVSKASAGVYHVVNSGAASWHQFACRIIELAGIDARVVPITSAEFGAVAKRPHYSVLANAKVGDSVGPMQHWDEALRSYLQAKDCAILAKRAGGE
jgi:dTDP-4-dehydrorhamnose reductase